MNNCKGIKWLLSGACSTGPHPQQFLYFAVTLTHKSSFSQKVLINNTPPCLCPGPFTLKLLNHTLSCANYKPQQLFSRPMSSSHYCKSTAARKHLITPRNTGHPWGIPLTRRCHPKPVGQRRL